MCVGDKREHLYAEYRHWIEKGRPFETVEDELIALVEYRDHFRDLLELQPDRPYSRLAGALSAFDIGTAYPLMLRLLTSDCGSDELRAICALVESYIVRRAVCGLTNKNLNRVFLTLVRTLQNSPVSVNVVSNYLRGLRGESAEWPVDPTFAEAWLNADMYHRLNNVRLAYILRSLNDTYGSSKTESIQIEGPVTVEHIMPQNWAENWLLQSGEKGLPSTELWFADDDDPIVIESRERNQAIQTMGNLTILTQSLNSSISNAEWHTKRSELLKHSLLPINLTLASQTTWNEDAIAGRGKQLFERALTVWPRPG